jgi:uncharacterized membrane protein
MCLRTLFWSALVWSLAQLIVGAVCLPSPRYACRAFYTSQSGFPFGHYYYTDNLGTKLFLVPVLIGPAYLGTA